MSGEFRRVGFIREAELCRSLDVSRTPVREALGRLASEGFLERIPHRGFRVPEDSLDRLLELYPIVSALELLTGKLAFPTLEESDLDELRALNRQLSEAVEAGDDVAAMQLNNRFHALIAERSGNERLGQLLDDLRAQLRRLETWYYSSRSHADRSVQQHDELIRALERGDIDRALEIFEGNMRLTRAAVLDETLAVDDRG